MLFWKKINIKNINTIDDYKKNNNIYLNIGNNLENYYNRSKKDSFLYKENNFKFNNKDINNLNNIRINTFDHIGFEVAAEKLLEFREVVPFFERRLLPVEGDLGIPLALSSAFVNPPGCAKKPLQGSFARISNKMFPSEFWMMIPTAFAVLQYKSNINGQGKGIF